MIDLNNIPELKPHRAYAVKTEKGTWYTVYSQKILDKVIADGDFESIHIRVIS